MSVHDVLRDCATAGRPALIGYLPVGYPTVDGSIAAMRALADGGADIIEVGMPYTDPVMDGPVIQDAADVALRGGVHVDDVFTAVEAVRDAGATPVVMSYYNLVLHRGVRRFAADLAAAGGAGLITPDLIPEEAADWIAASDAYDLDRIFLVAPSSTPDRLARVTAACRGFVYAASTMGVTGVRSEVGGGAADLVARVRQVTDLPVCVGLGVSTGDQAAAVGAYADGVIVGSALVRALAADILDHSEDGHPADGAHPHLELDPALRSLRSTTADLADGVRRSRRPAGTRTADTRTADTTTADTTTGST